MSPWISLLLPTFALIAGCAPTYLVPQSTPAEHTITVGGSASLDIVPDEACIELTLAARDASMAAAHAALTASSDALALELRQKTTLVVEPGAVSYTPEYDVDAGRSRLARYVASVQVNVRVRDCTQIPDVIARASARGLDRVNVVYYSTHIVAKKAEVRARALAAAGEKARAMTGALGVSLGEVVSVVEGDGHTSASVGVGNYLDRGAVDKTPDAPAPPGSIPLAMSVNIVYRLK